MIGTEFLSQNTGQTVSMTRLNLKKTKFGSNLHLITLKLKNSSILLACFKELKKHLQPIATMEFLSHLTCRTAITV